MSNSSKTAKGDAIHERIATFTRGSLAPEEAVRHATDDMEQKFSKEMSQQYQEYRRVGDSLRTINAPLAEIVNKDKRAAGELRKLRKSLSKQFDRKPVLLKSSGTHSMIKSGSIITLLTPPYDHLWEWIDPSNTGTADLIVDATDGTFGGTASSMFGPSPEGYGHGAVGFGVSFHPMSEALLWIGYQFTYSASWYETSSFDTAHTSGQSQILVYKYDLKWNYQGTSANASAPIWSDGTGWTETHAGRTPAPVVETFNPAAAQMAVSPESNYVIWFIGRWEADGTGDPNGLFNSEAQCNISGSLPYVLLEQS
jgi:hypothetical protein